MPKAQTKAKSAADAKPASTGEKQSSITPEERYRMIAEAAYFRAEKRGFTGDDIAEDWFQAEAEIDRYLQAGKEPPQGSAPTAKAIEQQVVAALESDPAAISERVRAITLQALSEGHLDTQSIKQVMTAVLNGAQRGFTREDEHRSQALREAVRGLDDALAYAAEATKLAIQEAAGRTSDYSRQGLKTAVDDLAELESQLVETLGKAAQSATGVAQATLRDLTEHARTSGTAVGDKARSALSELSHAVSGSARETTTAGAQVLRKEATLIAALAAGVLKGFSTHLQSAPTDKKAPPTGSGG